MAQEEAARFVGKYGSDEAFRKRVSAMDTPEAIRAYLDEEGFGHFTRQELGQARTAANASGVLSDAELEAVAGGAWATWDYDCSDYSSSDANCAGGYSCTSVW